MRCGICSSPRTFWRHSLGEQLLLDRLQRTCTCCDDRTGTRWGPRSVPRALLIEAGGGALEQRHEHEAWLAQAQQHECVLAVAFERHPDAHQLATRFPDRPHPAQQYSLPLSPASQPPVTPDAPCAIGR